MTGRASGEVDLLGLLWRHKLGIVLALVVGAVAGYSLSLTQPPRYTATSRVFLSANGPFDPLGQRSGGSGQSRFVLQQAQLMMARPLLEDVAQAVDLTVAEIAESVEVVPSSTTDLVSIRATADSPEAAAALADAVPEAYRAFAADGVAQTAARAASAVTDPRERTAIQTAAVVYGDGVALVEPAAVPSGPSQPQPLRNAALLSVLAGLAYVLGALLVDGRRRVGTGDHRRGSAQVSGEPVVGKPGPVASESGRAGAADRDAVRGPMTAQVRVPGRGIGAGARERGR